MKTIAFILITLISGAIAGTILGLINQLLAEPYIDRAIEIEVQNRETSGEIVDHNELVQYRSWQKGGAIVAGAILGTSLSALFGIVYAYSRDSLPGSNNKKKSVVLAGIMFLVIFFIPMLKYPANPPVVGDPETIEFRESLYISMLVISGFSALGVALLYRILGRTQRELRKIIVPVIYIVIIALAFAFLPANPDEITITSDLLMNFRIITTITMGIFWGIMGILLGSFWDVVKPHETKAPKLSTL
ncbi:MAG TPA: CbtA family protein [Nitrososphaeraceae archaeon]|jgi:predicted cobalt transporter CbtA|nr:CbtA family protein [Nitrososphaeraceae archaeon]